MTGSVLRHALALRCKIGDHERQGRATQATVRRPRTRRAQE
eukprot:CAMPEP_0204303346 /NCGR_PEP_ID=MMETSP0468-20130131/83738_1 /ASSEMBLY_ACC=CAM_ASM_000383 /TAXON_ID=2969 /ORGANISM="Oxyrrhis marina" /LENGTH=40 /DNA_ID= /DNA_START= /DNA_END= /DNA_ORIENTATION=